MSGSGDYRISKPNPALKLDLPHAIVDGAVSSTGKHDALMLRAASFIKPGVERTFYIEAASNFVAIGGLGAPSVNFQIASQGPGMNVYDRMDLEMTVINTSAAPIQLAPGFAFINKTSWYTAGAPLLEQYGESMMCLEALEPQEIAVQEMDNVGFTSTQILQLPQITGAVGAGSFSFPTVLTQQNALTIAPGATYTYIIPFSKDLFLCSPIVSPTHINQPINLRVQFNPANVWCQQGGGVCQVQTLRLTICGRIYQPILQSIIDEKRFRKPLRIPAHLITVTSSDIGVAVAGTTREQTLQSFTGDYSGLFCFLRTRDPDATVNGVTDFFWRARPLAYNIATGVVTAASVGNNYALRSLNISPNGTVSLWVSQALAAQGRLLAQESCDNDAYLLSQIKALNLIPFSDTFRNSVKHFNHVGGSVNLVSAGKIIYVPQNTIPDASLIVVGFKQVTIFQNSYGQLQCVDESGQAY